MKKSMFRALLALAILFLPCIILRTAAQQISVDDAMSKARTYLQSSSPRRAPSASGQTSSSELTLAYTGMSTDGQNTCFYIFNRGTNGGFIIIGADEAAQEILGYSDVGTFDYDNLPDNFKWWLGQYKLEISNAIEYIAAHSEDTTTTTSPAAKSPRKIISTTKHDVGPYLTTSWNQGSPYSDAINAAYEAQGGTSTFVTGCVATATAQVMYYYKCPATTGTGSYSYTCSSHSDFSPSANFGSTTYDWDNMLTSYSSYDGYTTDQGNAVATLMYHAGVALDMSYGTSAEGGSGASTLKIQYALPKYFGYDKSAYHENRTYYTDAEWEDKVYEELLAGRPLIYEGYTGTSGHCFVCDGYRTSDKFYSFNWGWGGSCDGWYAITGTGALTPNGTGIGGANAGDAYDQGQGAVFGLKPDAGGLESPDVRNNKSVLTLYDGGTAITSYEHTRGTSKTLTLTGNIWNCSESLTSFRLGVKATDTTTGQKFYWSVADATLAKNYLTNKSLNFDVNELPYNGTYEIKMVCRNISSSSDDEWREVGVATSVTRPTVTVSGASDPDKTDLTFYISNNIVQVSHTLQISTTAEYDGTVTYSSNKTSVATVDANGVITGKGAGTATITATAAGNTYFNPATATFNITVNPFVKNDVDVTIDATVLDIGNTGQISLTEDYEGTATYSSSDVSVASVSSTGVVTANKVGSATITVTIPATDLYNGKTVTFNVSVINSDIYLAETPYFNNDNNTYAGDCVLNYSLRNNSSSSQYVFLYIKLYKVEDNSETYIGLTGMYKSIPSSTTYKSTFDFEAIFSRYLTTGTKYRIKFFSDSDGSCSTPYNITSVDFTYYATLSHDFTISSMGVNTLILPFNASIPTTDKNGNAISWKAFECAGLEGNILALRQVNTLKRNTPYIIMGAAATCTFTGPELTAASTVLYGDSYLKGTTLANTYQYKSGDYILQEKDNKIAFYKYDSSTTTNAPQYGAFVQVGTTTQDYYVICGVTTDDSGSDPTPTTKTDPTATISTTSLTVGGATASITVTSGYDGTPTYSSSNTSVATVSNGVVTAKAAGTATITVTLPETDKYNAKTFTFNITVTDATPTEKVHTDATKPSDATKLTATFVSTNDTHAGSGETAAYLLDGSTSTKWCSVEGTSWSDLNFVVNMGKKVYFTYYELTEGGDTYSYPNRNWSTWTIEGSNDQSTWTKVTQEADKTSTLFRLSSDATSGQRTSKYAVAETGTAYQYYRITVNSIVGAETGNNNYYIMQMAEMAFYGTEYEEPEPEPEVVTGDLTLTHVSSGYNVTTYVASGETGAYLVDGNTSTKWCVAYGTATDLTTYMILKAELPDYTGAPYVTDITLTEGGDTPTNTNRNWKEWAIYGINSDSAPTSSTTGWTLIKSFDGSDPIRPTSSTSTTPLTKTYAVNATESYNYYKIVITSLVGTETVSGQQYSTMQMAELSMKGASGLSGSDGDVNGDGTVNHTDITILSNILLGKQTSTTNADIDGNGIVNIVDMTKLIKLMLKK